ncbi:MULTISPECIES: flagellar biosynthesis protein FlhB [unclassified Minwuia]|uniref:flagellar biosynthesis protein FlhB n=1 Tax=unclassified Minwuia TaxID=2618799 RepID=UPI00247A4E29|nr:MULTISPECIES: flagellar biosynthesis protein FlhB [unclassified Minwuia]
MAGDGQDKWEKTEEPTEQKLQEARKKGQVAKSQEVGHWFMMIGTAALLMFMIGNAGAILVDSLRAFVASPDRIIVDAGAMQGLFNGLVGSVAYAVLPIMGVLAVLAVVSTAVQHPIQLTPEKIKPELSKISPIAGLKRLFSVNSLLEFGKGILKLTLVAFVAFSLIWPDFDILPQLIAVPPLGILEFVRGEALTMVGGVMAVMTVIVAADFAYQKWKTRQDLRMSRRDIKDEQKQSDGDPMIKQKIRAIRMERSRRRMMAAVPEASVVIANPTHFAVALKYDMSALAAPVCVAKGVDQVALNIRQVAEENAVPVVENRPLARALHAVVELDEEIPPEHYKAVAEVISYVMNLSQSYSGGRAPARSIQN